MREDSSGTINMTEGSIFPKFILFMFPVLFGNLVQQIYGLVDSIIVGRSMGSQALAAIGATDSLTYLVIGCANGIASGFAICTAQAKGKGDDKVLRQYTIWITRLCLVLSGLAGVFMVCMASLILGLMNTPEDIRPLSAMYLMIIFSGLPVTMCLNALLAVLRSIGNSRVCFYLLMLSTGINIFLDLLLISHWGLGVAGAAVATVLAQLTALVAGVLYAKCKHREICFWGRLNSRHEPRDLMQQGIPMGIQVAITAVATMIIQMALNHCGTECIAAFTIGTKIQNMLTQLFHALGMTVATFVGQNAGRGDYVRVHRGIKVSLWIGGFCALLCIISILLSLDTQINFFGEDVTEKIRSDCHYFMNCCMAGYIPLSFLFVFRSALQAMGESKVTLIGGLCELIARGFVVAFLARPLGYYGVCFGHTIAWTTALVPLIFIYMGKRKGMFQCVQLQ